MRDRLTRGGEAERSEHTSKSCDLITLRKFFRCHSQQLSGVGLERDPPPPHPACFGNDFLTDVSGLGGGKADSGRSGCCPGPDPRGGSPWSPGKLSHPPRKVATAGVGWEAAPC